MFADDQVMPVSELTQKIKLHLEGTFRSVIVSGEVSNFKPASSGHWYFTLKDADAVLPCVMFKGRQGSVPAIPREGDIVEARGAISVYPPRGAYQLIVEAMRPSGRGTILLMLEERKQRLADAGLFERQRPLPWFPTSVVVVTSPTGAAIRDILQVLSRRRPDLTVRIVPVPVQGEGAGAKIAGAITYAGEHNLGDLLILGRGGGSLEDLLPFSDEAVVRAIAACPLPVISAVGHETDWALSDFAADMRAPTPSAAAELASVPAVEVTERIRRSQAELVRAFRTRLDGVYRRLEHSGETELRYRFRNFVQPWYQRLDEAGAAIREGLESRFTTMSHRVALLTERISSASPYTPLERGYAIIRDRTSARIVTRASGTVPGQSLTAEFADGQIFLERTHDE